MYDLISEKVAAFFTQYHHQEYTKGELLIRAGDDPVGIFYLKKGLVKQYAISKKGDELVINVFKPISFFPMSWAISSILNEYFFEALEPVEVWIAPKDKVVEFVKSNPDVLYSLVDRVYHGTSGLLSRMIYLMSGSAYPKLIIELIIQAKRFGKVGKDGSSYQLTINERDIAAQSGMTRETVSRELKTLKDKKLVTFDKTILTIINIGLLEEELASY